MLQHRDTTVSLWGLGIGRLYRSRRMPSSAYAPLRRTWPELLLPPDLPRPENTIFLAVLFH